MMSDRAGFVECDTCRSKPGTPLLCGSCFQNREVIVFLEAEIDRLQAIVAAQKELIWHYEDESDRSHFDDADMPPELVKLEKAVEAAEGKEPC